MSIEELISTSATALARAIRTRVVSSAEVVEAYLQRIAAVNSQLKAVVQVNAHAARQQAREADAALARGELTGPLHGVPFTVKDVFDTAGLISAVGLEERTTFVPTHDAVVSSPHTRGTSRSSGRPRSRPRKRRSRNCYSALTFIMLCALPLPVPSRGKLPSGAWRPHHPQKIRDEAGTLICRARTLREEAQRLQPRVVEGTVSLSLLPSAALSQAPEHMPNHLQHAADYHEDRSQPYNHKRLLD